MQLLPAALLMVAASAWSQVLSSLPMHEDIEIPEKPHFFGSNQGVTGVFGALGGIVASPEVEESRDKIKTWLRLCLQILDKGDRSEFSDSSFINNNTDGTPIHEVKNLLKTLKSRGQRSRARRRSRPRKW